MDETTIRRRTTIEPLELQHFRVINFPDTLWSKLQERPLSLAPWLDRRQIIGFHKVPLGACPFQIARNLYLFALHRTTLKTKVS
jgi:hypothetical protein